MRSALPPLRVRVSASHPEAVCGVGARSLRRDGIEGLPLVDLFNKIVLFCSYKHYYNHEHNFCEY